MTKGDEVYFPRNIFTKFLNLWPNQGVTTLNDKERAAHFADPFGRKNTYIEKQVPYGNLISTRQIRTPWFTNTPDTTYYTPSGSEVTKDNEALYNQYKTKFNMADSLRKINLDKYKKKLQRGGTFTVTTELEGTPQTGRRKTAAEIMAEARANQRAYRESVYNERFNNVGSSFQKPQAEAIIMPTRAQTQVEARMLPENVAYYVNLLARQKQQPAQTVVVQPAAQPATQSVAQTINKAGLMTGINNTLNSLPQLETGRRVSYIGGTVVPQPVSNQSVPVSNISRHPQTLQPGMPVVDEGMIRNNAELLSGRFVTPSLPSAEVTVKQPVEETISLVTIPSSNLNYIEGTVPYNPAIEEPAPTKHFRNVFTDASQRLNDFNRRPRVSQKERAKIMEEDERRMNIINERNRKPRKVRKERIGNAATQGTFRREQGGTLSYFQQGGSIEATDKEILIADFAVRLLKHMGVAEDDISAEDGSINPKYMNLIADAVDEVDSKEFWNEYQTDPDATIQSYIMAKNPEAIQIAKKGAKLRKLQSLKFKLI